MGKIKALISSIFWTTVNLLNRGAQIGGLEISESIIRFALIINNKIAKSPFVRLPVGVIKEGKIIDKEGFKKALINLHSQIVKNPRKKTPVILSIPDINAYAQVFSLPIVASANLEESVELNLRMISPIDFENAYYGWQKIGETENGGPQLEILGAFVQKNIIDDYLQILKEAGFSIAAVEFPALAVSRVLSAKSAAIQQSFVVLRFDSNGFSFSVVRDGKLYFSHSTSWQATQINLADLEDIIIKETRRVFNFCSSHWQQSINSLVLIIPNDKLKDEIGQIISRNFSVQIEPAEVFSSGETAKTLLPSINKEWFSVIGSAIRGLIPRSEDDILTLSGQSVQQEFRQHQILVFVRLWRNISLVFFVVVTLVFLGAEFFLVDTGKKLEAQITDVSKVAVNNQEFNILMDEVKKFNSKADLVVRIKNQTIDWSPFLEKMKKIAGSDIIIKRISVQSLEAPVVFYGEALNEQALINFKNNLSQDSQFEAVNLPLSAITPSLGNQVNFNLTFKLKNL